MKHRNRFLTWLINKLVEWYNRSSYKKIKVAPDVDPTVHQIVPTVVTERPKPPPPKPVPKTDPEVVKQALNKWFDNDMERIMMAIRTLLNQDPPWFHSH